jgi:hypothetical protein
MAKNIVEEIKGMKDMKRLKEIEDAVYERIEELEPKEKEKASSGGGCMTVNAFNKKGKSA